MTRTRRRGELRFNAVGAALVVLAGTAVTGLAALAAQRLDIEFSDLSRDPAAVVGAPPYTGWFANITVLVWLIPASVALFTALLTRRAGEREATRMLLTVGLISLVMVGDDFFQGHEILQYNLGLPGVAVFATYTVAALCWAWWFRRRLGVHVLTVLAAMGCWGVSATIDTLLSASAPYVIEDGAKLVGVALWTFMVVRVAFVEIANVPTGVPHIPAQRAAPARHRAPGASPEENDLTGAVHDSPEGAVPVREHRPARDLPPPDPEATTPVPRIRPRPPRHSRPVPVSQPVWRPQPTPQRLPGPPLRSGPRPGPAPQPIRASPRVVHDVRLPVVPPPMRRPGPAHRAPFR